MTSLETQSILADAKNIVARAMQRGEARIRSVEELDQAENRNKGIRVFTPEHRAKLRAARKRYFANSR